MTTPQRQREKRVSKKFSTKPIKGFAAVNGCVDRPYIMVWSIRGTAKIARKAVAEAWGSWDKALKDGVRIVRVTVAETRSRP